MAAERERAQLERLTFFSDAVFAIAITLLVIEVRVPELHRIGEWNLGASLINLLPKYIGFLSSFFVIGRFWVGHHELFGLLKASDGRLIWANLFMLMTIAFMPFPTAVFSEFVQLRVAVGFYTLWLALIGVANRVVTMSALGARRLVDDDVDDAAVRRRIRGTWVPIAIGLSAFAAGMIHPLLSLPALGVASPIFSRIFRPKVV